MERMSVRADRVMLYDRIAASFEYVDCAGWTVVGICDSPTISHLVILTLRDRDRRVPVALAVGQVIEIERA